MKIRMTWTIVAIFMTAYCQAGIEKNLEDFFNRFGSSSNVSSAEIYQGQKAGYATGGGLSVRNRVMNSKIVTVSMPSFDAGCGGIDAYMGGFSYINDEQFINMMKSIGSSAIGYAFLLGLKTVSPMISDTVEGLQVIANTVNSMNINSCETASTIVDAVWPKKLVGEGHVCQAALSNKGSAESYLSARGKCSDPNRYEFLSEEERKFVFGGVQNIVWEALKQQTLLVGNQKLSELFMTMIGTVITKQVKTSNGFKLEVQSWASKIKEPDFLEHLLKGGKLPIYRCGENKYDQCLTIDEKEIELNKNVAWFGKIRKMLGTIQEKILSDYYTIRGWDEEGQPTGETRRALGLESG